MRAVKTRIVLIRHGLVDAASRLCGSFDVPMSPSGFAQLEALVQRKATGPRPHALYASTLTRATQVASRLGPAWGLDSHPAEWAREIHCGQLEGRPLEELRVRFPGLWARNQAQDDDDFAWPGGESYRAFRTRVLAGLATVGANHAGERVAIVTHAGVISQVLGTIRGRTASAWAVDRPDPLTATEVAWEDGGPIEVLTYNDPDWY